MTYTPEQFERMEHDPELVRCYFWQVAMNARRMARKRKQVIHHQAVCSSPVAFDEAVDYAKNELHWAQIEENLANVILENLDALVKSSPIEIVN